MPMADMTLEDLAAKMGKIDFAMLVTKAEDGTLASRPMSNNGEVDASGDSYYFTWDESRMAADIRRDHRIGLTFQGSAGLLGKPPLFVSVEADAELVPDRAAFKAHWSRDLDRWFQDGIDTPGVVMIRAHATRIHYWDGSDEGEVRL